MAMTFNEITGRFTTAAGVELKVQAGLEKGGRWHYRSMTTGALLASGLTPAQFARSFWLTELKG